MKRTGAWLMAALLATACEPRAGDEPGVAVDTTGAAPAVGAPGTTQAAATEVLLMDREGNNVGIAHITPRGDAAEVHVRVSGLTPDQEHGIHFHRTGRCDPPAFETAGDHFNPQNRQHGLDNPQGPHAGDLPNLHAGADGVAETTFTSQHLLAGNAQMPAEGIALVVHAQRDDQRTDPSGNSGDRIACGVVHMH